MAAICVLYKDVLFHYGKILWKKEEYFNPSGIVLISIVDTDNFAIFGSEVEYSVKCRHNVSIRSIAELKLPVVVEWNPYLAISGIGGEDT